MSRISKSALLGASDLREKEVTLDSLDGSPTVLVRGLGAGFSNQAQSEALEMVTTPKGEQIARVNTAKMEAIQVLHGLADPKLSTVEEAEHFMGQCGPAARKIVDAIDELSGVDKEAIEKAEAKFQSGEEVTAESAGPVADPVGDGGPDVPSRVGVEDGEVGSGVDHG